MAENKKVTIPSGEWTKISDDALTGNFQVQFQSNSGGYVAFAPEATAPAEGAADWFAPGWQGFSSSVEEAAAGTTDRYLWARPVGSRSMTVSLSYA